jgi:hypothetical protein
LSGKNTINNGFFKGYLLTKVNKAKSMVVSCRLMVFRSYSGYPLYLLPLEGSGKRMPLLSGLDKPLR